MQFDSNVPFLTSFSRCFDLSVFLAQDTQIIWSEPENTPLQSLLRLNLADIQNTHAYYYIDGDNLFWGAIPLKAPKCLAIFGPVPPVPISQEESRRLVRRIPDHRERDAAAKMLCQLPYYSEEKLLQFVSHFYLGLCGQELPVSQVFRVSDEVEALPIAKKHTTVTYNRREISKSHSSYAFEQRYLQFIRKGDAAALEDLFRHAPSISVGTVALNSLRQVKNIFITAVTTATRAAIEGGLAPVEAYNLSDVYILQMEAMTDTDRIYQLQYRMLLDFARRVAAVKLPEHLSRPIRKCAIYIASHVNEALTVQQAADWAGVSRSHLSRQFSQEMGISVSGYIQQTKLEEAKRLLKYSEKTIGEISSYLCFSSQSYFQNVFHKQCGMTPLAYRNQRDSDA